MRGFFHLNNSLGNKWFNFKIPFWSIYTIIPFPTCFSMGYLRPIVFEFYHVMAQRQVLGLQFDRSSQPFDYLPQFFPQHFVHDLDYPILQLHGSFDVYPHIPSTLWISTSYVVFMATNALEPMMQFATPLLPLHEMLASTWDENNYNCFLQPHSSLLVDELELC